MKRYLKIILPFVLIAAVFVLYNTLAWTGGSYYDTEGYWAEAIIEKWSGRGVITGSYGAFRPSDGVTRAEMCTIISRVTELPEPSEDAYSDLEADQWFADVMLRCVSAGVLAPEGDTLQPDKQLSRQEALDMLLRALGVEQAHGMEFLTRHYHLGGANNFGYDEDVRMEDDLYELRYGSLDPDAPLSRAELVLMLDACQAEGYLEAE